MWLKDLKFNDWRDVCRTEIRSNNVKNDVGLMKENVYFFVHMAILDIALNEVSS